MGCLNVLDALMGGTDLSLSLSLSLSKQNSTLNPTLDPTQRKEKVKTSLIVTTWTYTAHLDTTRRDETRRDETVVCKIGAEKQEGAVCNAAK